MNLVAKIGIAAAATAAAGMVGWKIGNLSPEPVSDGITKREVGPAIASSLFFGVVATGAIELAWLSGNHLANTPKAPKMGFALLAGGAIGLAFGAGMGFGMYNGESYDYPKVTDTKH